MLANVKIHAEVEVITCDSAPDGVVEQTVTMSTEDPDAQEFLQHLADVVGRADDHNLRMYTVERNRIVFHRNGGAGI